ncbi:hypothetical protein MSP8886_00215 [Marinomonas spartinae]|uniref:Uncharacterized protein n=1 Tax=Marinomonas spartinae TaxID=1792290 RepID=A0A1A8T2P2_9GAMM|nr:DNA-processing protein DprA [Marinomonas spartinae]SBS25244.1 hypothetical protein MSP8886_00215 [Marinomonas spartinae]
MTVSHLSTLPSSHSNDTPSSNDVSLNNPCAFLSEEDWLCLSFLTGIGPSRLSRLYTYLEQLATGSSCFSESMFSESTHSSVSGNLFESDLPTESEPYSQDSNHSITYELLRSLKWPEITAREAMSYLDHGLLTEEQNQKREISLDWLEKPDHHVIFQHHPSYPEALKQISVAPTFLYVEGALAGLSKPKVGIVGARHCTGYGREAILQMAEQLAKRGVCVVSGGARGIDTAAHQGALNGKATPTIAVMGTGLLHRYPKQNTKLFESILTQGGVLLSEYPLMTEVRAHLFPPRNRIISGLSSGILVAEASPKSGSLISANYAMQQNREVFALPGRVVDSQSEGCHQLIRQGAILIRNVNDIFTECPALLQNISEEKQNVSHGTLGRKPNLHDTSSDLNVPDKDKLECDMKRSITSLPESLSKEAKMVANLLEEDTQALDFDALIRHTQLTAQALMQALMELELSTCIVNYNGRYERC